MTVFMCFHVGPCLCLYIYAYVCMYVLICVCVLEKKREKKERENRIVLSALSIKRNIERDQ